MIEMQGVAAQLNPAMSTQWQRNKIVQLCRRASWSSTRVTLMHRRVGVPDSFMDKPIDAWLSTLTVDAANGVIRTLQEITA